MYKKKIITQWADLNVDQMDESALGTKMGLLESPLSWGPAPSWCPGVANRGTPPYGRKVTQSLCLNNTEVSRHRVRMDVSSQGMSFHWRWEGWERCVDLTVLWVSFATLATDTGHGIQAVLCDHTRGVEEESPAAAGPSLPLSSGRVRSSEEGLSRWAEDSAGDGSSGGYLRVQGKAVGWWGSRWEQSMLDREPGTRAVQGVSTEIRRYARRSMYIQQGSGI